MYSIIVSSLLVFTAGCLQNHTNGDSAQTSQRVTLQDLGPIHTPSFQNQISFNIITFEIAQDNIAALNKTLKSFGSKNITFQNQDLYVQNGVSVSEGKSLRGSELTQQLASLNAVRLSRKALTTLDQTAELFITTAFPEQRYIFFTTGTTQTSRAFDAGHLGWMIKPKLTTKADTIQLQIAPAYAPLIRLKLPQATEKDDYQATYVPPGRFDCTLEQGDFLILAPARIPTSTTIDAVLFDADHTKGKIRLYVLIFMAAEQ